MYKRQPWDWAYYTEKVRADKYSFDENQLKPYFEMTNVLENGVFYAANQLYGLSSVSYTHLDVYKRQHVHRGYSEEMLEGFIEEIMTLLPADVLQRPAGG